MTNTQLRDAAWAELVQTTVGWNKVKGYSPAKLATTHWGKAKKLLDQIADTPAPTPSAVYPATNRYPSETL